MSMGASPQNHLLPIRSDSLLQLCTLKKRYPGQRTPSQTPSHAPLRAAFSFACRAHVHQDSLPLRLAADYHIGGPLTLRAVAGQIQTTVPLAASRAGALLLFTGLRDVATHFQLQEGGQSPGARNSSFQVMRCGEANAPTPRSMPGAWHQVRAHQAHPCLG